nr:EH domain-containing protein 1-like [Populus alba]
MTNLLMKKLPAQCSVIFLKKEQNDLLMDLLDIPKKACDRRINEFVKRARAANIHSYIISHLQKEMPSLMGKTKTQKRLINNLEDEFANSEVKQSSVRKAEGCSLQEVLWKRVLVVCKYILLHAC